MRAFRTAFEGTAWLGRCARRLAEGSRGPLGYSANDEGVDRLARFAGVVVVIVADLVSDAVMEGRLVRGGGFAISLSFLVRLASSTSSCASFGTHPPVTPSQI